MNKEDLRKKMGLETGDTKIYKLNKVTMSGDTGDFTFTDLLSDRPKGEKPHKEDLGKSVDGVIIRKRWQLTRYDEPSGTFYSSTEYDNKHTDTVTVYPPKEKGTVEALKAKYQLKTEQVVYFYLPLKKEVVRLIVKASALSGIDKNPNGEWGLFELLNEYANNDELPLQYVTHCSNVFRAGKNQDGSPNKRKDHYAMTFSKGRALNDSEFDKMQLLLNEVHEKTTKPIIEEETATPETPNDNWDEVLDETISAPKNSNYPADEINPDDIPF